MEKLFCAGYLMGFFYIVVSSNDKPKMLNSVLLSVKKIKYDRFNPLMTNVPII